MSGREKEELKGVSLCREKNEDNIGMIVEKEMN